MEKCFVPKFSFLFSKSHVSSPQQHPPLPPFIITGCFIHLKVEANVQDTNVHKCVGLSPLLHVSARLCHPQGFSTSILKFAKIIINYACNIHYTKHTATKRNII